VKRPFAFAVLTELIWYDLTLDSPASNVIGRMGEMRKRGATYPSVGLLNVKDREAMRVNQRSIWRHSSLRGEFEHRTDSIPSRLRRTRRFYGTLIFAIQSSRVQLLSRTESGAEDGA
jgi:hypothetical protein